MTSKTVRIETHGVMASIAETFSTCMTFLALVQPDFPSDSVSDNLLSDFSQKLPMMESHVGRISDAVLMLRVGHFEKRFGGSGVLWEKRGHDAVSEWHQQNQYGNGYK